MKYSLLIMAFALALAGCNKQPERDEAATESATEPAEANSGGPDVTLPNLSVQPSDARTYLDKAAASDSFEIQSSRAFLKLGKDAALREFAEMMIKAHQASTAKLRSAAAKLHLTPGSAKLSDDQQQKLDALKSATEADIDQLYLTSQRSAHADALDLHRHYASDGDTAELKEAASGIVPEVQKHMDALDKLSKRPDGG